ncbi:MAG: hypothetical protein IKV55_05475 [Oscillospiraceae bacterium]|nr:hypothetical protein [Oscillospiraceae bacterium]
MSAVSLTHHKNTACPALAELLVGRDAINYSVLKSIICGPCSDIFTDNESIILCYSTAPYPVWVWAKELRPAAVEAIGACIKEHFPLENDFAFIADRPLLDALKALDSYFENTEVTLRLCSHKLEQLTAPVRTPNGCADLARAEETQLLAAMYRDMELESETMELPWEMCVEKMAGFIALNHLFVWRTEQGEITALASRDDCAPYSKISTVYTVPVHRRRGYADAVTRHACQSIINDGLIPILYTDGDYAPSNDCYRKIGFTQLAELCTVKRA